MTATRFLALAVAGSLGCMLFDAPASAGPILPDPTIGVRGNDGGSPPVTDGSANRLRQCATLAPADTTGIDLTGIEGFFCAPYEFTGTEGYGPTIRSFDLAFWDKTGTPTPVICLEDCEFLNFVPSEESQFHSVARVDDFIVRLARSCPDSCFDPAIFPGHLVLFVEEFAYDGGFVSIQGINGSNAFQTDLATPGEAITAVPEPASLVLVGTGVAGLIARRRLRRSGRALI